MRLLRVIRQTNPESGGPIEGLLRSSEVLIRNGHEVEVVSLESADEAESRGFSFPVTGLGRGIGKYGYNPKLIPWVKENARRFDAVVLHGLWNYSSVGAWRGLKNQSIPFFVFIHGMMDPWFRHRCPLKHILKSVYWQVAEGRVLNDAAGVLFTSEEECSRARGVFYGKSYKERVVRYGVPSPPRDEPMQKAKFSSRFPNLEDKRFLLFLGRIHPKKGCDLLLKGFAEARNEIGPEIQLAIAGPGSSSYIAELKRLAYELMIANQVHWLGMLRDDVKWGALHSAEAFILPSHQENFGIAVAEAMSCSTPVLISDKVNIWREIAASRGGLVQADTAVGTYNLIRDFYRLSEAERTQMGVAAREGFLRNFEIEAAALDFARAIGFAPSVASEASRNKKILQVIHSTVPESGGPIEAVRRISEVLISEGHQVEVACLETEEEASSRAFPFPIVGLGEGKGRFGYNPTFTNWIRENAKDFDAVILHGLWNYSSLGAWLGLRRSSTPYFIYSHGMLDRYFRDRYPVKHLAKQLYWWLAEGRVLRDALAVLFTCEEERIRARNVFLGYMYRERIVRFGTMDPGADGVSEKVAFRSSLPALGDRPFLLFLSRIHPKKGCDLLIRAFACNLDQIPPDLDLVIAGPDQVGLTPGLKSLANQLGIGQRIHWPGMLKGELKWGAFRSAEAMILPSHQENFGIVVAESMACSTPVLISDKVNVWREVVSSQAGLVEPDTLQGTTNLIHRFATMSESERIMMKSAARQGFLKHFTMEATASDFLQLMDMVKRAN
ncbi:glycosyltransferase [Telmatobacter sp. DSM 110680]|uniref:Glycosyltransferase n=1 Tax=Telmatobacter sp. DSM 110680 TaxID=3036704 RepID=A0AAU7DEE5_9BACT